MTEPAASSTSAAEIVAGAKRQRVDDGRATPPATLDIVMTPITGSGLPMPPLAPLHSIATSSLPASLHSSTLPLPFPTASTLPASTSAAPPAAPSASLTAASPSGGSIDSPPRPSAALVSLVDQYAYKLHLPPAQARLALHLVSSIVASSPTCQSSLHSSAADNQRAWAACCIWLSVLLLSLPSSAYAATAFAPQQLASPTLTELLILFSMPLSTFLRHAAHVQSHITPLLLPSESTVVADRCNAWLQRWLYACALWRKYEKMYASSIYPHMAALELKQSPAMTGMGLGLWRSADLYGCGWLLFQCVKGELRLTEAHPTYVMLLCVLRLMLCCVMREISREQSTADGITASSASESAMESALREVCQHDGAVDTQLLSAVRAMHSTDLQPLLTRLQDHGSLRFPAPSQQYDLFGPSSLQANITSLGHLLDSRPQADDVTAVCFVLDERVFLMDRMTEADSGGGAVQQQQVQQVVDVNSEYDAKMNGKGSAPSHRRILFGGGGGADSNGIAATSPTQASSTSSSLSSSLPSTSPSARSTFSSSSSVTFATPHKLTTPHHAFSPSLRPPQLSSHPHQSPTHPNHPRTPISRMLESVSFLHSTFSPLPASPSAALQSYFAARQAGGLDALVRLVSGVVSKVRISDGGGGSGAGGSSEAKRELGVKIYWSVIDALVNASSSSSSSSSPSSSASSPPSSSSSAAPSWLLSRSFHCALLCVCFELVFSAYKHTLLSFPHSLHLFDIKYFDLLKVVDTALRYLPPLPAALKAHVAGMEISMCERRCWAHGEKAAEMMADERVRAKVEEIMRHAINNQSTTAVNSVHRQSNSDEMKDDVTLSSSNDATKPTSTSLPLPTSPSFRADFSALLSLYRKLLSLCADRLSYMSTDLALSLSPLQQQATWTLLLHCLLRHPSLLFGRHVDTILLCCLYTVKVKICKSEYDFKRIMMVYADRWDKEVTHVIREVEGKPAAEADGGTAVKKLSIIQFYNEIFVRTVEPFVLTTLQPAVLQPPTTTAASSAAAPTTARPPPLSPLPVRSRHSLTDGSSSPSDSYPNIFISTMRNNIPPSPQQRVLSAVVGESPTKRLQEMNEMLAQGGSRRGGSVVKGRGGGSSGGGGTAGSRNLFRVVVEDSGKSEAGSVVPEAVVAEVNGGVGVVGAADGVAALLLASGSTAGSNGHTHRR